MTPLSHKVQASLPNACGRMVKTMPFSPARLTALPPTWTREFQAKMGLDTALIVLP